MSDSLLNSITVMNIQLSLHKLLAGYQSEKEEANRDNDIPSMQYWESACQTIYELAVELGVPFKENKDKRCPHKPDNMTVPDTVK